MPTPLSIAYSENYLKWLLGSGDVSNLTDPHRAKIATEILLERLGNQVRVFEPACTAAAREAVDSIHDPSYVSEVVEQGRSSEWAGLKTELGETALLMFEGTKVLVEQFHTLLTRTGCGTETQREIVIQMIDSQSSLMPSSQEPKVSRVSPQCWAVGCWLGGF